MTSAEMDREDVMAAIKKRFRFVSAFERAYGLPEKSVNDVLRGRTNARVSNAISDALSKPVASFKSETSDDANRGSQPAHRLNAGAR